MAMSATKATGGEGRGEEEEEEEEERGRDHFLNGKGDTRFLCRDGIRFRSSFSNIEPDYWKSLPEKPQS